jgi:hypothetical protein
LQTLLIMASTSSVGPGIDLPSGYGLDQVHYGPHKKPDPRKSPTPELGILAKFTGEFAGTGFNTIFRPRSKPVRPAEFPTDEYFPNQPLDFGKEHDNNVLQLNLTVETLRFSKPLGIVPNRGLGLQNDIFLNGVPYVQSIRDVTNDDTGKADKSPPTDIHFEPGLWMHVPASETSETASLSRMASIPHGATINAQGPAPPLEPIQGPPEFEFDENSLFPFDVDQPTRIFHKGFTNLIATQKNVPRLPQDLSKFIQEGTITPDFLVDPTSSVLQKANEGKKILEHVKFTVSTTRTGLAEPTEVLGLKEGGGIGNIAFLVGDDPLNGTTAQNANAKAAQVESTFWVSTVEHVLEIPVFSPGQKPLHIKPQGRFHGDRVPTFILDPPEEITEPRQITVTSTQIQYSQTVYLNFAKLSWPHISVATLVPKTLQKIPTSAWQS